MQSNDHKKYVKLSHVFQRIIGIEYLICIHISLIIHVYGICVLIFERFLRKHNKADCLLMTG